MKRGQTGIIKRRPGTGTSKKLPKTPQRAPLAKKAPPTESRDEDASPSKSPVRYITEGLIKQTTGKDSLIDVLSLRLSVRKDDGKKIRYIENLEGLKRLQVLNLSFNQIQKMERLGHLTRLKELDLSCNCIARIEGLETLLHLQILNLSHNLIESIPAWLGKRLKALRDFNMEGNMLFSLSDVARLRPLKDIVSLSLSNNPLCDLAHYRLYAIFHLRTVGLLDGKQVTEPERLEAEERFAQEEIENLEVQLEAREKSFQALEADHTTTLDEKKKTEGKAQELKKKAHLNQEKVKELENELKAKDELLRRKTAELTKACEKQYRLEQELAFHKIDAKFEPLPDGAFLDQIDGGTEESAYIGRASFRRNEFASEQYLTPRGQQLRYHHTPGSSEVDPSMRRQLNETLDNTLADKEKQIERAEERLEKLHKQLANADDQISAVNKRLREAELKMETKPPLEEEERHRLEGLLAEHLHSVVGLKDRITQLEDGMSTTLDIIEAKDREMADLKRQLALLEEGDPRHAELQAQLADRELQAAQVSRNYSNLQHDLDNTLGRLTAEMDRVKGLEQQLADGQADLNDELRTELQGIVGGLTDYLNQVKGQVVDQQRENARLQQEKEELLGRLSDAERRRKEEGQKKVAALEKKLRDTEEARQDVEAENLNLKESQREMSKSDPEKDARLRAAIDEANKLKNALRRQQREAEADKEALEQELEAQRSELQRAANQARQAGGQQAETQDAVKQLADAKRANEALKNHLRDQQAQYDDLMNSSLHPEEVAQRISHAGDTLANSRGENGNLVGPQGEGDLVGESLAGLQGQVMGRMRQAQQEADRAKRYQQKAEGEAKSLRHQLEQMQARLRDMAARDQDQSKNKDADWEDQEEMERMRDEVGRLRQQLQQTKNQQPPPRPPPQPPAVMTQVDSRSAPPGGIDPRVRDQMNRLQGDVANLRNQLQNKDRMAAQQLADAENEILQLQSELGKREKEAREEERIKMKAQEREAREAERRQASAMAQAEIEGGQLAQRAINELAKAQEEIDDLEEVLANRERDLEETLRHGETASQAIANQQEEIGALHDVLEAQKDEILRLQELVDGVRIAQEPAAPQTTTDLQNLLAEIAGLRQALDGQQHHMNTTGLSRGATLPPFTPTADPAFNNTGYHGNTSFMPPGNPQQPPPSGNMNYAPQSVPYAPQHSTLPPAPMMAPSTFGNDVRPSVSFAPLNQNQAPPMQFPMQGNVPFQPTVVPTTLSGVPPQSSAMPVGGTASEQAMFHPLGQHAPAKQGVHLSREPDITISEDRRGRLRQVDGPFEGLFCNVPEHHDLEDEIDRLRKQLDRLKRSKRTERQTNSPNTSGRMSRLRHDLMDKRDELDALDLAVSRQQGALKRIREDNDDLLYQKESKLRELRELDRAVDDRRLRRDFLDRRLQFEPREEDYDMVDDHRLLEQSGFLEDEIECLEDTLAKRRAELREADKLLLQCQTDLHEAQNKASETLRQYDKATHDLTLAREEKEELERRSHDVAVDLVQAQERLLILEKEVEELEERRRTSERDAGEMETLLTTREMELRAVEAKRDQSSKRLERLKSEVIIAEQKLSELQSSLRDGEREQSNRQSELDRLQDQLDQQQHALEKANREIGAKQTDLRTLTSETDKHRLQLVSALQEGESEIAATQQKIKDTKNNLERLRQQRHETSQAVEQRREELSRLLAKVTEAEGALHDTQSAIEKQQAELKHTLEMVQIEKTELEALRMQHEAKMTELEKTQLTALQEKASLEKLKEDGQRSRTEAELMKEEARRVKDERDRILSERRSLEDSLEGLVREEGGLKQACNSLEVKLNHLKTTHGSTLESLHLNQHKLEGIQQDLVAMETELEDNKRRKSEVLRELQNLKQHVKETKSNLKRTHSDLQEADGQQEKLQEEIQELVKQKAQLSSQLDQLSEVLDQHRLTVDQCEDQEKTQHEALSLMGRELDRKKVELEIKTSELAERERDLKKMAERVALEEDRLTKVSRQTARDQEMLRAQLETKQRELEMRQSELTMLSQQKDSIQTRLHKNEEDRIHYDDIKKQIKELEKVISDEQEKGGKLEDELKATKTMVSSLQKEKEAVEREKNQSDQENKQMRARWSSAQKDFRVEHRKLMQEIETLKVKLEEEAKHASRMSKEVEMWRQEYLITKQQLHTHEDLVDQENKLDSQLQHLKEEIQTEVNEGLRTLEMSRLEVLDELQEVHHQKAEISKKLTSFKQVKMAEITTQKENSKRKHIDLEFQLQQEQDLLKLRLEQQMSRQSEVLAGIKQKSESTIQSLRHKLNHLEDLVTSSSSNAQSLRTSQSIIEQHDRNIDLVPLQNEGDQNVRSDNMTMDPNSEYTIQYERRETTRTRRFEKQNETTSINISQRRQDGIDGRDEGALSINELQTQEGDMQRHVGRHGDATREGIGDRGSKSSQRRGILKRKTPLQTEGGTVTEHEDGERRDRGPEDVRGRHRSEEVTGSESEVNQSQRPRSHSYRHHRRKSRSPVRSVSPPSPHVPERGPPSSPHWSHFMDSLNQLKDQKVAQLNTNRWDYR